MSWKNVENKDRFICRKLNMSWKNVENKYLLSGDYTKKRWRVPNFNIKISKKKSFDNNQQKWNIYSFLKLNERTDFWAHLLQQWQLHADLLTKCFRFLQRHNDARFYSCDDWTYECQLHRFTNISIQTFLSKKKKKNKE